MIAVMVMVVMMIEMIMVMIITMLIMRRMMKRMMMMIIIMLIMMRMMSLNAARSMKHFSQNLHCQCIFQHIEGFACASLDFNQRNEAYL